MGTGGAGKIKNNIEINHIIQQLQECIQVYDHELGDGKNVPRFIPLGNSQFRLSWGQINYIFTISVEKKGKI